MVYNSTRFKHPYFYIEQQCSSENSKGNKNGCSIDRHKLPEWHPLATTIFNSKTDTNTTT